MTMRQPLSSGTLNNNNSHRVYTWVSMCVRVRACVRENTERWLRGFVFVSKKANISSNHRSVLPLFSRSQTVRCACGVWKLGNEMRTCAFRFLSVCICVRACVCLRTCACARFAYYFVNICVCVNEYMNMCVCACVYVCMYSKTSLSRPLTGLNSSGPFREVVDL